ncbi:putative reverse transcriptase domain-containing protein [Tanacetum coccineum]
MEQELWTLTLKGDDIVAYNNRFYELVLMCPELVSTKNKKIEKYIRGFPKRFKGNITSSKPATLHEAIIMARELVEQSVQGRAARIGESNNRRWEDHQRNTINNHHQQQNRRQKAARAYAAAPAEGKVYAGNLSLCNKCKFHHYGQCTVKCANCKRFDQLTRDCKSLVSTNNQRNLTCYECGNQGHYKNDCPELKNRNHGNQVGEVSRVHHTFHVSNLKKCHVDEPLVVPFDGLHIDDKLHFIEENIEIMDREVKWLKPSYIPNCESSLELSARS